VGDALSVAGVLRGRLKRAKRVRFAHYDFIVGEGVEYETTPLQRLDLQRLVEGPEPQALFYAAVASLLEPGDFTAKVLLAFPVEPLSHVNIAGEFSHELKKWLLGEHKFSVNDADYRLVVEELQLWPQGAAAYFDWLLNERGLLTRDRNILRQMVGVCDIGFRTVNFFTIARGEVMRRLTGGNDSGIKTAADTLTTLVWNHHSIRLTPLEAEKFLRNPKEQLVKFGELVDISPLVQQALRTALSRILTHAEAIWEGGKSLAKILLAGGGAKLLGHELKARFPQAEVLEDPVFANARGLAKIAARRWGQDAQEPKPTTQAV
jgi:hypothetical protein